MIVYGPALNAERPSVVQHPDPYVGKVQWIRLADVLVLGPAMIAVGVTGTVPGWLRLPAVVAGVATIWFNWRNYLRVRALR